MDKTVKIKFRTQQPKTDVLFYRISQKRNFI